MPEVEVLQTRRKYHRVGRCVHVDNMKELADVDAVLLVILFHQCAECWNRRDELRSRNLLYNAERLVKLVGTMAFKWKVPKHLVEPATCNDERDELDCEAILVLSNLKRYYN